jgi:3',5'-cyclic-AMP phosphodiesterase
MENKYMKTIGKLSRRCLLTTGLATSLCVPSAFSQPQVTQPSPRPNRKRVLRLAHLTDVHVYSERMSAQGFAECLNHVQAQHDQPEMIFFGGDNVMNVDGDGRNTADEQLRIWNKVLKDHCSLPYKIVVGNHDVLANNPVDGKRWAVDSYGLPNRYYSFEQAGWNFIVLDSTFPLEEGYKGRLDEEQRQWLEKTLNKISKTTPICIISHIPILSPCCYFDGENEETGDWIVPGSWMHIDARYLKGVFYRHPNVRLCLSGHSHLVDTATYLNVTYACNGAVSGAWWEGANQEFNPGYALVDLYDDGSSRIEFVNYGWIAKS